MLFKTCGKNNIAGTGFEERRDTAFGVMQNGVVSGHGFYATTYESVYVLGQCEGDVGDSDCSGCVKNALEKAQVECGSAISGQIYLHKCFIAYSYYPNGVPRRSSSSSSSSSGSGGSSSSDPSSSTGESFLSLFQLCLFKISLILNFYRVKLIFTLILKLQCGTSSCVFSLNVFFY